MFKRVLLGALVGGIVMFCWGALSHMALGLGEVGISELPNEAAVLPALRDGIREPGFYFFPGMKNAAGATQEEKNKQWQQKYMAGPNGVLIYHPTGSQPMSPARFGTQLATNVAAALLAALLLASAALGSFSTRVMFVGALGLLPSVATTIPYWNWFGFPGNYTAAVLLDQVIGFTLAGLVLATIVKPAPPSAARVSTAA